MDWTPYSSPALSSALPISAMSSLILAMSPALLVRAFLAAGDGPSFVRLDELAGATAAMLRVVV